MNAYLLELLTYLFRLCFNQCNASLHFGSSKHSSVSKTLPPSPWVNMLVFSSGLLFTILFWFSCCCSWLLVPNLDGHLVPWGVLLSAWHFCGSRFHFIIHSCERIVHPPVCLERHACTSVPSGVQLWSCQAVCIRASVESERSHSVMNLFFPGVDLFWFFILLLWAVACLVYQSDFSPLFHVSSVASFVWLQFHP
jgi:hypothetical protein